MGHVCLSILIVFLLAHAPATVAAKIQGTKCAQNSLDRKNCILQRGPHRIQFRGETMNSFDGVHRSLVTIPIAGPNIQWNAINWKSLGSRQFVEFEIWEGPKTQGDLSALRWLIYEVSGVELRPKLDKVIHRKKKVEGKGAYELDKLRSYKLSLEKNEVRWKVDFETGVIK